MDRARGSAPADRRAELAVLLAEVRRVSILGRRLVNAAVAGGYHSVFRGTGMEFEEVREYAAGDDPRTVDWNVTARVGRLHVKKYVDERERTVAFLLDLSPSMDAGAGPWSARQVAARVLACLALSAVRHHDRAALVAFGGGVESFVPPRRGTGHALRILRDALALEARGPGTGIAAALEFSRRALRRHAVVFVISDFLAGGWQEAMGRCARRHDVIAVRLLAPGFAPGASGMVRVRDPESGRERVLDLGSRAVRADLARREALWRERTEQDLARARVDLMDVPLPRTRDPEAVAGPILRFFRMRELRGAKA